ncbi:MAG: hypothetical protein WA869_34945 [Alloacidobacterium sp.]
MGVDLARSVPDFLPVRPPLRTSIKYGYVIGIDLSDGCADQVSRPPSSPRPSLVDVNLGKSAL